MKKLFLLFFLLSASIAYSAINHTVTNNYPDQTKAKAKMTDEYKPLVVEGRTWWYGCTNYYALDTKDFGMRIGKEVEMDGKIWNEVRIIKSIEHDSNWMYFNPKEEDILVAYVREEDRKVYSRVLGDDQFSQLFNNIICYDSNVDNLIYDFSDKDSEFIFGSPDHVVKFKVSNIDKIENSGNEYARWTALYQKQPNEYDYPYEAYQYAEQIGVTHPFILSEVFYYPFIEPTVGVGDESPVLRYVTEGEDNTIIYEGIGGHKLWEVTQSVDNVCVDSDTSAPVEYFDMQGRRIDRPTSGTIAIRRQGSTVTKVLVK